MASFDLFHNTRRRIIEISSFLLYLVLARSQPSWFEVAKQRCSDLSEDLTGLDHDLYVSELGFSLPIIHALEPQR